MINKTIYYFIYLVIFTGILSCKENPTRNIDNTKSEEKVGVFNFDNKNELSAYNSMNLDDTHPNLLNPKISDSDFNSVKESWVDLHKRIGKHLTANNFEWGIKDETVTILQKIYFNRNGEIENYFFRVLNQNVTLEKKKKFAELIAAFASNNQIEFKSDKSFAQCGKTKYLNE